MQATAPWLSLSIWIPILAGFVVMATGRDDNARVARAIALLGAAIGFAVTIPLYTGFDVTTSAMQFVEKTRGSRASTSTTTSASTGSRCCSSS